MFGKVKNEEGMLSAFIILFLVTLTLLSFGVSTMIRNEGITLANRVQGLQTDYTANSGAQYALRRLLIANVPNTTLDIMGSTVTVDTSLVFSHTVINIQSILNDITKSLEVSLVEYPVIWTTNNVSSVNDIELDGSWAWGDLIIENASSVAVIDTTSMISIANIVSGNLTVTADYPAGASSFFFAAGLPHITYVSGNLTVRTSGTAWGIYIVEGDVTVEGGLFSPGEIEGVLYMPNASSDVDLESNAQIIGGVCGYARVRSVNWIRGEAIHHPVRLGHFYAYRTDDDDGSQRLFAGWRYL